MDIEYVDIFTGENCCQFTLLIWTELIGKFVDPVGWEDWGKSGRWKGFIILASCVYHFIRVHEKLVQHPSNYLSIVAAHMREVLLNCKLLC